MFNVSPGSFSIFLVIDCSYHLDKFRGIVKEKPARRFVVLINQIEIGIQLFKYTANCLR